MIRFFTDVDVHAYISGDELIITDEGDLASIFDEEEASAHNCDEMGCGWCHVIARIKIPHSFVVKQSLVTT